ncbi:MAG: hypothetical protein AYK18_07465 [Theionarchaea archaeon DG-70]|nr:MAG: hypothetical protein AYK18_07465 [Theionarchaea archaeon DG-70]
MVFFIYSVKRLKKKKIQESKRRLGFIERAGASFAILLKIKSVWRFHPPLPYNTFFASSPSFFFISYNTHQ